MLSFLSDTSIPRVPKYFESLLSPFPAEYLSQAVCGSVANIVRYSFAKIVPLHEQKKGKRNIGILKGKSKVSFAKNFKITTDELFS